VRSALPIVPQPVPYNPRSESTHSSSSNEPDTPELGPLRNNLDAQRPDASPKMLTPTSPPHPPVTGRHPKSLVADNHVVGSTLVAAREADLGQCTSTASQTVAVPRIPRLHADDLRAGLAHATSAAECRVLVDMFLAQCGHELSARAVDGAEAPLRADFQQHERSVVGALLADDGRDGNADTTVKPSAPTGLLVAGQC